MDKDISLDLVTAFPLWLVILAVLLAFIFAVWSYVRTLPPVSRFLRWFLVSLRLFSLLGAIVILGQPVLDIKFLRVENARIIVLVDRSESMSVSQNNVIKDSLISSIITSESSADFWRKHKIEFVTFAEKIRKTTKKRDEVVREIPDGVGTNISDTWFEALTKFATDDVSAGLIISDGAHNVGPDPAYALSNSSIPIWTIGVGEVNQTPDLMMRSVNTNKIVYMNESVPVEVSFRAIGAAGRYVTVKLSNSNGKTVIKKRLQIKSDYHEDQVVFNIDVTQPGLVPYNAEISGIESELTEDNNKRNFFLNVMKNKIRILIMAGYPDDDLGDLVRRLKKNQNIEIVQRTSNKNGFYEGSWLDSTSISSFDVVVLHHFPVRENSEKALRKFARILSNLNKPVCYFTGGEINNNKLSELEIILPFNSRQNRPEYFTSQVYPAKRHAVIHEPEELDYRAKWAKMPPLRYASGIYTLKPDAEVIATIRSGDKGKEEPAIVLFESTKQKSAAILVSNLWKWGMSQRDLDETYDNFLQRLIRWLVLERTTEQVDITIEKNIFSAHEQVDFVVHVLDENFEPLSGCNVLVEVTEGNQTVLKLSPIESDIGLFNGKIVSLDVGNYVLSAVAEKEKLIVGKSTERMIIEPFSIELLDVRLNEDLLKTISSSTGGEYAHYTHADSMLSNLSFPMRDVMESHRIEIWGRGWLLLCIICFLALEWTIRIGKGML